MMTWEETVFRCGSGWYRQGASSERKYAGDRPADLSHLRLFLEFFIPEKTEIRGFTSLQFFPLSQPVETITLHAKEMQIHDVRLSFQPLSIPSPLVLWEEILPLSEPVEWEYPGDELHCSLPAPVEREKSFVLHISYSCQPRRGLYFFIPDKTNPYKTVQVWSQGEDEENRYWIPCYDAPNERFSADLFFSVPHPYICISNGELLEKIPSNGTTIYHWYEKTPFVSYLISVVVGEFAEIKDEYRGIPLLYYVEPSRKDDALRSFAKTPRMMEFFENYTGIPYPYKKYSQVCVREFLFGGMENISATTHTELTLHDERAHLDFSSEPLVAHELAHQWWGNLVTCKEWAHIWLNEGFATYFEALWKEHDLGKEEFLYEMWLKAQRYFEEDAQGVRRPIVSRSYTYPLELFDRHSYEKGSWVLHMLRFLLGEDVFQKALSFYALRHRGQSVDTTHLIQSLEEFTGKSLQPFFDQWVYSEGFPELTVSYSYQAEKRRGLLNIKQTHKTPIIAPGETLPRPFSFPLVISAVDKKGGKWEEKVTISELFHTFPLPEKFLPARIEIDPGNWILKKMTLEFPPSILINTLKQSEDIMSKVFACTSLARNGNVEAIDALKNILLGKEFWGVQASAAQALGEIRTPLACQALITSLSTQHPKARRAVVTALGNFVSEEAGSALLSYVRSDPSYFVEGSAVVSLARTRYSNLLPVLEENLKKESWNDYLRIQTLSAFAEIPEPDGIIEKILPYVTSPYPVHLCQAALQVLGKVIQKIPPRQKKAYTAYLVPYLTHPKMHLRLGAVQALGYAEDESALPFLETIQHQDPADIVKRAAKKAIEQIKNAYQRPQDYFKLKDELDKVKEEMRKLSERLQTLEKTQGKKRSSRPR
ncbi:MAG: M1 family aminopeptidase [bacterium JZ-2024 1]